MAGVAEVRKVSRKREAERRYIPVLSAPVEVREGDGTAPATLEGYGAVFNQRATIVGWFAEWEEEWAPGAFAKTLQESDIRSFFNHDENIILGRNRAGTLTLNEDAHGLRYVVRPPDSEWGRPVVEAVRRGDVTGSSIMFRVVKDQWTRPAARGENPQRRILEAQLFEVGPVTFPAFPQTSVAARAMGAQDDTAGVLERALNLADLAQHGYPLDVDDRQAFAAAAALLRGWAGEPAAEEDAGQGPDPAPESASHSPEQRAGEPGAEDARHSPEFWTQQLQVMALRLGIDK